MQFNDDVIENIKVKHFTFCKDNISESFISPMLLRFAILMLIYIFCENKTQFLFGFGF